MKWKIAAIAAAVILLIGVNIFLIVKEDSKVKRSLYVNNWTEAKEQNLQKTLETKGVTVPVEEQQVYYDSNKGSFEGFTVDKGAEVDSGSSLFYYSIDSYQEAKSILEAEQAGLERELDGLEDRKRSLGRLLTSKSATQEEEEETPTNRSVELDLYETEAEIQRLESKIKEYDERIRLIDNKLPYLQAVSDIDGFVKEINKDLSNPVLTVASHEVMVAGRVLESEHHDLEPGMEVEVVFQNSGDHYEGRVETVSTFPEGEPRVGKESVYSFTVVLDEAVDNVPHGASVGVEIITAEVMDAITVPAKSIVKSGEVENIFVLNNGKIEKREIESDLEVHETVEIRSGLEEGEIVSTKPFNFENGVPTFFTPMKITKWDKDMYESMRKLEMLKHVGRGFLSM